MSKTEIRNAAREVENPRNFCQNYEKWADFEIFCLFFEVKSAEKWHTCEIHYPIKIRGVSTVAGL